MQTDATISWEHQTHAFVLDWGLTRPDIWRDKGMISALTPTLLVFVFRFLPELPNFFLNSLIYKAVWGFGSSTLKRKKGVCVCAHLDMVLNQDASDSQPSFFTSGTSVVNQKRKLKLLISLLWSCQRSLWAGGMLWLLMLNHESVLYLHPSREQEHVKIQKKRSPVRAQCFLPIYYSNEYAVFKKCCLFVFIYILQSFHSAFFTNSRWVLELCPWRSTFSKRFGRIGHPLVSLLPFEKRYTGRTTLFLTAFANSNFQIIPKQRGKPYPEGGPEWKAKSWSLWVERPPFKTFFSCIPMRWSAAPQIQLSPIYDVGTIIMKNHPYSRLFYTIFSSLY